MKQALCFLAAATAACGGTSEPAEPKRHGPTQGERGALSFRYDDWGLEDLNASIQLHTNAELIFRPIGATVVPMPSRLVVESRDPTIVTCREIIFEDRGYVTECYAFGAGETLLSIKDGAEIIDSASVRSAAVVALSVSIDRGGSFVMVDATAPIAIGEQTEIGFAMLDANGGRVISKCPLEIKTDPEDARYSGALGCSSADIYINPGDQLSLVARVQQLEPGAEPLEQRVNVTR